MKVFISYSHADVQMAQRLKNYLLRENIEVLNDKFNVSTGSNVLSSISQAIDNSDAVLFLISKNINKSEWAQQEISLAVTSKLNGRNVKLIPVLIDRHAAIPFF
ncbi:TPA: toll/interleukin-1 receptor domain-containing protein [Klebsiella pneumoniae]|nr:toll/interleukin-1 receptor domain-containing protein [Klebsiella pneumoniae]